MKDSIRNSLAGRFLLTIAGVIFVVMGIGTFISFSITNNSILENTKVQLQNQVGGAIQHAEMWLESQRIQISSLGREAIFRNALERDRVSEVAADLVESRLSWMGLSFDYFSSLSLLDLEGNVVVSDLLEEERVSLSIDEELFARALAGELVVSPVFTSFHNGRYVFALYAVVGHRGENSGVLYFEYDLATLSEQFFEELQTGTTAYTLLLDQQNRVIVQPDERVIEPERLSSQFGTARLDDQFVRYENSIPMFAYAGTIGFLDCSLMLNVPYDEILIPSQKLGKVNALVAIIALILIVGLITILWQKEIASPIGEIIQGINSFHDGALRKPISTHFRNEFKTVAESFNSMAVDIEQSTVSIEVLRQEQRNLQTILDSMIIGIVIVDENEQTMMINSSLLHILGQSGKREGATDLLAKVRGETHLFADLKNHKYEELEFINSKGESYSLLRVVQSIMLNNSKVFLAMFVDITPQKEAEREQRQLEQELQSAGRLKAIGTLAAGISHEINTPIQYIGDNVRFVSDAMQDVLQVIETYKGEFLECRTKGSCSVKMEAIDTKEEEVDLPFLQEEIPLSLKQSLEGLENVARIVLAMKTFSHQGEETMAPTDINLAIENTLVVSKNEWKLVARVEHIADENLPQPECFSGDINQVFLNLIVNGSHAIEAKGLENPLETESITIKTYAEDGYVCVAVSDTGTGMTDEVKSRVFEHFFTTKEVGRGTGQGLSLAYQIVVEKHGGQLLVDSVPGKGSTFTVKLPYQNTSE